MTNDDARQLHDVFVREARARTPRLVPLDWSNPARTEEHEESWVFVYRDAVPDDPGAYEAVVVRKDGSGPYILLGAIGKTFRAVGTELGWPRSNERWLGSGPGRYQAFDGGLVVWHEDPGLAYGRRVPVDMMTGRRCTGLVAFVDLRGFSRWARRRNPEEIQVLMASLEALLQDAFNKAWCKLLFVKGVGDGIMIVSERDWYASDAGHRDEMLGPPATQLRTGHLSAFLRACGQFVGEGRAAIPSELAIGCGIDLGELNQVFLFGQSDYLGEAINNAAHLQQLAWNEVIISTRYAELLIGSDEEGSALPGRGVALADRGLRIDPSVCS